MAHTFLSEAWFDAVEELRGEIPEVPQEVRDVALNVVVTGGPDGDREVNFTSGQFARGLADDAPTTVTVPFDVAKAMFIDGNPQAAMQAFMAGQIQVQGDITRLMALQAQAGSMIAPNAEQLEFYKKLRDLTE